MCFRSISSRWSTLPTLLKVYSMLNIIALLIILIHNWKAFLFLPAFYIPFIVIYYYWQNNYPHLDFELIVKIYVLSNSIGMIVVMIVQSMIAIPFGILCFGFKQFFQLYEEIQSSNFKSYKDIKNLSVEKNFSYHIFIFLLSFLMAAGIEETLKYIMVNYAKRKMQRNSPSILDYQIYAIITSLGFSTMENIAFQLAAGFNSNVSILNLFSDAMIRIIVSTPSHCLFGYLIGLRIIRRDIFKQPLSFWDIVKWSIFLHGITNLWILLIAAHDLAPSTTVWNVLAVILSAISGYIVLKRERKIVAKLQNSVVKKNDD